MHIETWNLPSSAQMEQIDSLAARCDGYDPSILPGLPCLAACSHGQLTGFLSYLPFEENETREAELFVMVDPDHRKQGIAAALLKAASPLLHANGIVSPVAIVPEFLQESHLTGPTAYLEELLQLYPERFFQLYEPVSAASTAHQTCFYHHDRHRHHYWLTQQNQRNAPVLASLAFSPCSSYSNLYSVWVHPSLRHKGIGTFFLSAVLQDYFQKDQSRPLLLNVRSTNLPACRLYEKCGFTEVSRIVFSKVRLP